MFIEVKDFLKKKNKMNEMKRCPEVNTLGDTIEQLLSGEIAICTLIYNDNINNRDIYVVPHYKD